MVVGGSRFQSLEFAAEVGEMERSGSGWYEIVNDLVFEIVPYGQYFSFVR